ncbi:hypothetical protein [Jannaschia seohaensis]|uniref:Uncharacterized protein n=1 Tax=Jannaschia seohaensis TaxID=475081 RepID=A0A2Y9AQL0_9RHOB|nr:hypothetical protein [Jannaschia seohaensis]PWJ18226.1 hypothetical protein BCF38_105214 [Jannaschia seohaensis]SSA46751.1 hypothetical protein SAMN05421539_105214 [Jannaschia seohaensis]
MKLILTTAAATFALASSAVAYTGVSPSILSSVESIIEEQGLSVDVTTLSDEQVLEIYSAGQVDDANQRITLIRGALDEENYASRMITERREDLTMVDEATGLAPMGENSVVISVKNYLETEGFMVDASTLTDRQVAEIYFLAYSDSDEDHRDAIETILNM